MSNSIGFTMSQAGECQNDPGTEGVHNNYKISMKPAQAAEQVQNSNVQPQDPDIGSKSDLEIWPGNYAFIPARNFRQFVPEICKEIYGDGMDTPITEILQAVRDPSLRSGSTCARRE